MDKIFFCEILKIYGQWIGDVLKFCKVRKMRESNFFTFVEYLNAQVANSNEYCIAKAIIASVDRIMMLSLEEIADQASISVASVSRFVKKLGFESFADFKLAMYLQMNDIVKMRGMVNSSRFKNNDVTSLVDTMYQNGRANLEGTYDSLDKAKLEQLVKSLKNASSVTFLGDYHALASFYLVQLDLMAHKIPCYSFYNRDYAHQSFRGLGQSDLVIYFSVTTNFNNPDDLQALKSASRWGARLICLAQEEFLYDGLEFDLFYKYGLNESYNDGYYSLFLLSNIISNMLYLDL